MSSEPEIERKLSPSEKFHWVIDRESRINFVMHAAVSGILQEQTIRTALDIIQRRHPLLRVCIMRTWRGSLRFKSGDIRAIPVRVVGAPAGVCPSGADNPGFVPEDKWVEEAEREINTPFKSEECPLARCVLIRHGDTKTTVLLTVHHSIGDGKAGAFLMRDLFRAASKVQKGESAGLPGLPPRMDMTAYFPGWAKGISGRLRYIRFGLRVLSAMVRWGAPAMPLVDRKAPVRMRRACIVAKTLNAATVANLHKRARIEKTTLHGALIASQILAVVHERGSAKELAFIIGSPVNLRARLDPPVEDDLGLFITVGISINRAGFSTDFWQLAREVRQSLLECVERGDPFVYVMMHNDLSAVAGLFGSGGVGARVYTAIAGKLHLGGLAFSNIGRVDIAADHDSFVVESLGFAASASGLAVLVPFVATTDTVTTWNFVGMEPLISREHTARIADKACKILIDAI